MNHRRRCIATGVVILGMVLFVLPANVLAQARAGEQINWQVISGGGIRATSASWILNGTVGQVAIGTGASASYGLNSGYWQDFGGGDCCVLPGDANDDGSRDISDLTYYVDWMFGGGSAPVCAEEFDNDGNCSLDISDLTYFVDWMFGGGAAPVACHVCP